MISNQPRSDHKCDICGMAFSQAGNLKKHNNAVHNGPNIRRFEVHKFFVETKVL